MANDDHSVGSLRPLPHFNPIPPEIRASVNESLTMWWPVPQHRRDGFVAVIAQGIAGLHGTFPLRQSAIPEPEASRVAAAAEAEGLAAALAYAAGKSQVVTVEERSDAYKLYVRASWKSAYSYARSLPQAAGTSRLGAAAALPPPAASGAAWPGSVAQCRGHRPRQRRRLLPPPPQV